MSDTRIIIAGWETVDPARRADVLASFGDLLRRSSQAPGCLDVAISADALDPSRINVFEIWESSEHLEAWRQVCNPPPPLADLSVGEMQKYAVANSSGLFD